MTWFGHVQRRPTTAPARKSFSMQVDDPLRGKGKPKRMWMEEVVVIYLKKLQPIRGFGSERIGMENQNYRHQNNIF